MSDNQQFPIVDVADLNMLASLCKSNTVLSDVILACVKQGVDYTKFVTSETNTQRLETAIAEVLANIDLTCAHFDLNMSAILIGVSKKTKELKG